MKQDTVSRAIQRVRKVFKLFCEEIAQAELVNDAKTLDLEQMTELIKRVFLQILACEILNHQGVLKITIDSDALQNYKEYQKIFEIHPHWMLKGLRKSSKINAKLNLQSVNLNKTIQSIRAFLKETTFSNIEDAAYFFVYSFESLIEFRFKRCKVDNILKIDISDSRKQTGAFYTPKNLVKYTVKSAFERFFEANQDFAVEEIKICDPALGGGLFLIESADYLYAKSRVKPEKTAFFKQMFENNLYGVDKNPLAVEVARIAFMMLCHPLILDEQKLDSRLKDGDTLLCVSRKRINSYKPVLSRGKIKNSHLKTSRKLTLSHNQVKKWCRLWFSKPSDKELYSALTEFYETPDKSVPKTAVNNCKAFCWEFEFPEIIGNNRGFDLIISNPPYRSYYSKHSGKKADKSVMFERFAAANLSEINNMKAVTGRINYFLLFIVRATELMNKTHGVCSFVLPDTILMNEGYANMRQALLTSGMLKDAINFADPQFNGATVGTSIISWQKGQPNTNVRLKNVKTDNKTGKYSEIQSEYTVEEVLSRPFHSILYTDRIESYNHNNFIPLKEIAYVKDGINPGKRNVREALVVDQPKNKTKKLIEGSSINKYNISWQDKYVIYDQEMISKEQKLEGTSLRKAWIFDSPKIVYRQTSPEIVAAVDESGYYALNSVQCIILQEQDDQLLYALCAYLNSSFLRKAYQEITGETRKTYPQVHVSAVKLLPVPEKLITDKEIQSKISEIARELTKFSTSQTKNVMLKSKSHERLTREIDYIIDSLVTGSKR